MDGRAWNECTKWLSDDAYQLVNQAVNILNTFGYDVKLDNTEHNGFGRTNLCPDGSLYYEVGIKEIVDEPRRILSVHEALAPVVTCFHEVCGHGGQWRNEAQKEDPLSRVLLLNDLACKSSNDYFGVDSSYTVPTRQYFEQPHEIVAQYMALKMTQKFLSVVYNEEQANKLLCEYVNLRIESGNAFIPAPDDYEMEIPADGRKPYMKPTEPFTSMTDVYDRFQKTFVEQVFKPVDYKVTKNSTDSVSITIDNQKWPWERVWSRKQVNEISDRLTQAYVLSAIWLDQRVAFQWIKELPVFEHMQFPENISELIRNGPEQPKENELDLELLTEDDIDFTRAVEQISTDVTSGMAKG